MSNLDKLLAGTFLGKILEADGFEFISPNNPIDEQEREINEMNELEKRLYSFADNQIAICKSDEDQITVLSSQIKAARELMWASIRERVGCCDGFIAIREGFKIVSMPENKMQLPFPSDDGITISVIIC